MGGLGTSRQSLYPLPLVDVEHRAAQTTNESLSVTYSLTTLILGKPLVAHDRERSMVERNGCHLETVTHCDLSSYDATITSRCQLTLDNFWPLSLIQKPCRLDRHWIHWAVGEHSLSHLPPNRRPQYRAFLTTHPFLVAEAPSASSVPSFVPSFSSGGTGALLSRGVWVGVW